MNRIGATVGAVLLWATAMTADVQASGNRISFTGSVFVPTCRATEVAANPVPHQVRGQCSSTVAAAPYTVRIEPATTAMPSSRLIEYYRTYMQASGARTVQVATQTYD